MKYYIFLFVVIFLISCKGKKVKGNNDSSTISISENDDIKNSNFYELGELKDNKRRGVWKKYKDSILISVDHYFDNKITYKLDVNDFIFDSVNIERFNIKYPIKWGIQSFKSEGVLIAIWKKSKKRNLELI